MTSRFTVSISLAIPIALASCDAGDAGHSLPSAVSPQPSIVGASDTRRPPGLAEPQLLASRFIKPVSIGLWNGYVYVSDVCTVQSVPYDGSASPQTIFETDRPGAASSCVVTQLLFGQSALVVGFGDEAEGRGMQIRYDGSAGNLVVRGPGIRVLGLISNWLVYARYWSIWAVNLDTHERKMLLSSQVLARNAVSDGRAIYVQDEATNDLVVITLAGGKPLKLISDNSSVGQYVGDKTNLYLSVDGEVKEVAKTSGAVSTLVTGDVRVLAVNDGELFILFDRTIKAYSKATGRLRIIAWNVEPTVAVADNTSLFYVEQKNGGARLYRVALTG